MEARVRNNSHEKNIYIVFKSSEDANTPESSQSPISPGSTAKRPVHFATSNLFVWTDPASDPIWMGVVPTKVQKDIIVSPEKREVSYDGVTLPSGFSPITDPQALTREEMNSWLHQGKISMCIWLILFLIIVAIFVYFFWWRK
uniref:Uncharacterized protein n=1 Tax=Marseillevirus LCMAC101 TaxID=2506602 RepID=A0A481YQF7_9VIRU|nr:MAG: hypothetical protein LCMAC101_00280 [Marseillevirus LCMAC101]